MVNRLVHGSFCYVLTINHLSNHSYLVYTIDVSVIASHPLLPPPFVGGEQCST